MYKQDGYRKRDQLCTILQKPLLTILINGFVEFCDGLSFIPRDSFLGEVFNTINGKMLSDFPHDQDI